MKNRKLFLSLEIILCLILAIGVTFAWIPRNWAPEINYHKISVSTSGALIISFDGSDAHTSVDITEMMNKKDLILKQVSSLDGESFVSADFKPVISNGVPKYTKNDNNESDNYIETVFYLKCNSVQDGTKAIFFHEDSFIGFPDGATPENNAYRAIRISIKVGDKAGDPVIFANKRPGFPYQAADASIAPGENIFDNYKEDKTRLNSKVLGYQDVNSFTEFNGVNSPICYISNNEATKIIIRIWLEGCDPDCISKIAGEVMDVTIKFDSKDVVQ